MSADMIVVYIILWCSKDKGWRRALKRRSIFDPVPAGMKTLYDAASVNLRRTKKIKRALEKYHPTRYFVIRAIQVSKI